jgi:hypothetical protein
MLDGINPPARVSALSSLGGDVFKFLHGFSEMQQSAMREGTSPQELMPKILKLAAETRG